MISTHNISARLTSLRVSFQSSFRLEHISNSMKSHHLQSVFATVFQCVMINQLWNKIHKKISVRLLVFRRLIMWQGQFTVLFILTVHIQCSTSAEILNMARKCRRRVFSSF